MDLRFSILFASQPPPDGFVYIIIFTRLSGREDIGFIALTVPYWPMLSKSKSSLFITERDKLLDSPILNALSDLDFAFISLTFTKNVQLESCEPSSESFEPLHLPSLSS